MTWLLIGVAITVFVIYSLDRFGQERVILAVIILSLALAATDAWLRARNGPPDGDYITDLH